MLLVRPERGTTRVVQACSCAGAAGVRAGMALTHARALLPPETHPEVVVEPYDEARETRALAAFAAWALRFSPVVAPDPPDGIRIDVTGCERLYGGERRLLNVVANAIEWHGFRVRVAIADTYGAAWALARYGCDERVIVAPGDPRSALAELPIAALRLDAATLETLDGIGVETIAHLLDVPRLELATRFDETLLHRIDQAIGLTPEPIEPVRLRARPRAERIFDGPVTQPEAIERSARVLLDELVEVLERQERGVRRLDVILDRVDADPEHTTVRCSRPTRRVPHLWSLLRPRIERLHLGFGVESMRLEATAHEPLRHEQMRGAWGDDGDALVTGDGPRRSTMPLLGELMDAFAARWGSARTYRVKGCASHLPEHAARLVPLAPDVNAGRRERTTGPQGSFVLPEGLNAIARGSPPDHGSRALARAARPSHLLVPPEPVEVVALSPDGPPSWVGWRGSGGPVRSCVGPERIAGTWWHERPDRSAPPDAVVTTDPTLAWLTRDYYRVEDDTGRWIWIFRELETGRWYLHGLWA